MFLFSTLQGPSSKVIHPQLERFELGASAMSSFPLFAEMYVGVGARRMRDLFDAAKKQSPVFLKTLLFILTFNILNI
jgi:hypothetical protein